MPECLPPPGLPWQMCEFPPHKGGGWAAGGVRKSESGLGCWGSAHVRIRSAPLRAHQPAVLKGKVYTMPCGEDLRLISSTVSDSCSTESKHSLSEDLPLWEWRGHQPGSQDARDTACVFKTLLCRPPAPSEPREPLGV